MLVSEVLDNLFLLKHVLVTLKGKEICLFYSSGCSRACTTITWGLAWGSFWIAGWSILSLQGSLGYKKSDKAEEPLFFFYNTSPMEYKRFHKIILTTFKIRSHHVLKLPSWPLILNIHHIGNHFHFKELCPLWWHAYWLSSRPSWSAPWTVAFLFLELIIALISLCFPGRCCPNKLYPAS